MIVEDSKPRGKGIENIAQQWVRPNPSDKHNLKWGKKVCNGLPPPAKSVIPNISTLDNITISSIEQCYVASAQ